MRTTTRLIILIGLAALAIGCGNTPRELGSENAHSTFTVQRYNDAGFPDAGLGETVACRTERTGTETTVVVEILDREPMWGVTLDLEYDITELTPVTVEFAGLIETPISFSSQKVPGLVGLGQVSTIGPNRRSGEFARVVFRSEPLRAAAVADAVWIDPVDTVYKPEIATGLTTGVAGFSIDRSLEWKIYSVCAAADGNSDGHTTIGDLTPIGKYWGGGLVSDEDYSPAIADYDRNGIVTVSDLMPLGWNYEAYIDGFEIWLHDDEYDFGYLAQEMIAQVSWESGTKSNPPDDGSPITDWQQVFRYWHGSVDSNKIYELDMDWDTGVYISTRVFNEQCKGSFSDPVFIRPYHDYDDSIYIDDFVLEITGATGGSGESTDRFLADDTINVTANSEYEFAIVDVKGGFNGTPFEGPDFPGSAEQYDTILDAFNQSIECNSTKRDNPDFKLTGNLLALPPGSGSGTFTCSPDSALNCEPEGTFTVVFPEAAVWNYTKSKEPAAIPPLLFFVTGDITREYTVNLQADPRAATVVGIKSSAGQSGEWHMLDSTTDTTVTCAFNYGPAQTSEPVSVGVTLFDLSTMDTAYEFACSSVEPPGTRMYTINANLNPAESDKLLTAVIGPDELTDAHRYVIRLEIDGVFNSINCPGEFLAVGSLP